MDSNIDVELAREGDADAFARLVSRHANLVCAVAIAVVRNVPASEDVAQEAFLAAWKGIANLRDAGRFCPWLAQITRNQARLWLRRHRNEVATDKQLLSAPDPRPLPDTRLGDEEEQRIVVEVMNALPAETREALVLYYREGNSTAEVASQLGISEDAARQRLSRARSVVRDEALRRFGLLASNSAPAAAFVSVVTAALTGASSRASAATTAGAALKSVASGGVAGLIKISGIGVAAGCAGVIMSMLHLGDPFDEDEAAELRKFALTALLIMIAASFGFAAAASLDRHPPRLWSLAVLLLSISALGYHYIVRLPRILARRLEWERQMNPVVDALPRWRQIYAAIAQTVSAALSGLILAGVVGRLW